MAYRFRRKETAASGVRRIVREQTATIVSLLADRGNDLGNRVHDARRLIKRMRALLRLVRGALEPTIFAAAEETLRAAGRTLATTRDADVCLATLEALTRRSGEKHEELHRFFRGLAGRARRAATRAQLGRIAANVRKSGFTIAEAGFSSDGWKLLAPGLTRSVRSARKSRRCLNGQPNEAELHQWRTRLKRLYHQLELFCNVLSKPQRKLVKNLERLATILGEHHDLSLLEDCLRESLQHGIDATQSVPIESLIACRRKLLLRRIRKLSDTAFCDGAKVTLRRIHQGWKGARKRWKRSEAAE